MSLTRGAAWAACLVLLASGASAQDLTLSLGGALTTDYVSRGQSQTNGGPALQGYIEGQYGMGYAGVWASNVDYGTSDPSLEVDFTAGVRPQLGDLSVDAGIAYYTYYPDVNSNYGEIIVKAEYPVTESLTVGAKAAYAPDFAQTGDSNFYMEGNAAYQAPPMLIGGVDTGDRLSVSGAVGYNSFGDEALTDHYTWNIGASYALTENLTADLRYHDSGRSNYGCDPADSCDARLALTLSADFTPEGLRDLGGLFNR